VQGLFQFIFMLF